MTSVFWFSKLKAGVDPAVYELWVQETDYRLAQEVAAIEHYRVHRVVGPVEGEGPAAYDYIEVLQVVDIDAYRAAMKQDPAIQRIIAEIGPFVDGVGSAWGTMIAPLGKEQ
jgi:hypothetical protein